MKSIKKVVAEIKDEVHKSMGLKQLYPGVHIFEGELVYVINHVLYDSTYGRLSNWVDYRIINKNGSLGKDIKGCYGGGMVPINGYNVRVVKQRG